MCEQAGAWLGFPPDLLQLHPDSSQFCPAAPLAQITQITQFLPALEVVGL